MRSTDPILPDELTLRLVGGSHVEEIAFQADPFARHVARGEAQPRMHAGIEAPAAEVGLTPGTSSTALVTSGTGAGLSLNHQKSASAATVSVPGAERAPASPAGCAPVGVAPTSRQARSAQRSWCWGFICGAGRGGVARSGAGVLHRIAGHHRI